MSYHSDFRYARYEATWTFWRVLRWSIIPILALGIFGYACSWFGEAGQVAREQFGPRAALKKYEWFKEAHAQLSRRQADIAVYEKRLASARSLIDSGKADRTDKERFAVAESEYSGLVASYNGLVAEYNAASSKFNWTPFKGEVPATVVPYAEGSPK